MPRLAFDEGCAWRGVGEVSVIREMPVARALNETGRGKEISIDQRNG